ncbi:flagellar basal body-associated FliL family protein [Undibacterium sp. TJN25]|uniref:flagellar basal body-associated FliL family protein n=1 Tax=Undibacterium sp. TJN25 TaxID=3413056 RepID=UPI003BF2682F
MAKKAEAENLTTYVAVLASIGVAGILAGIWFYKASRTESAPQPSYLDLSLPTVHIPGYGVRADVAVEADGEDADWLKQQREPLGSLLQKTLVGADPEEIRTTKGLQELQANMAKVANSSLRSDKVRGVYLTNFLMQSE